MDAVIPRKIQENWMNDTEKNWQSDAAQARNSLYQRKYDVLLKKCTQAEKVCSIF